MNYSSFFIPYISQLYTKEDLIDIIENTYQIGKVGEIDIVLSRKGNYMAFIHMNSIFISDKTNKMFSIIHEQGQYYLYDIKKRMKIILKRMIQKNEKKPYEYEIKNIKNIEKIAEDINIKMNKKFIGVYTEIENIKQILSDIQRKVYGYSMSNKRIGNTNENDINAWS